MNSNKLLRLANIFYSLATKEELPDILKHIEQLETYTDRKEYAEKNLKHLSSGSSRLVYLTSDKTVIKLAKNDKGVAQNKVEANPKMKSKFVNKIISHAKDYCWIQTHFLEKITKPEFEKMTGISFDDFGEAIRYGLKKVSDNSELTKPENFDKVEKTEIYKEILRLGKEFKLLPGDLARISSIGIKDNHPVLIDAGLSSAVFSEFYDSSNS